MKSSPSSAPNTTTSATQTSAATTAAASSPAANLQDLLGADHPPRWWQRSTPWIALGAVVVIGVGVYYWQERQRAKAAPVYVTETVAHGSLTLTVSATGTLQPTRSVNVGSELSGTVRNVLVDVNDKIRKGQVLVELDTAKLDAQVLRSRASLNVARARQAQSEATGKEAQANLARLEEVSRLSGGKVPSASELDAGRATVERAMADITSARASVEDARAALSTDETNLSKASITSPIDGVVLTRSVDPGNAVAASLQAVTLFSVAEDLTKLRLEVNVDEADVGSMKVGQKASFTVSAYPARKYPATVTRVAYGSTKTDNVVTYTAVLDVNNEDLSLRPGMTAAATITSTERDDVLVVPNTALRFTPAEPGAGKGGAGKGGAGAAGQGGRARSGSEGGGIMSQLMPPRPGGRPGGAGGRRGAGGEGAAPGANKRVWVLEDGVPKPVRITTGISDGRMTEVTEVRGEGLAVGAQVITDQRTAGAAP